MSYCGLRSANIDKDTNHCKLQHNTIPWSDLTQSDKDTYANLTSHNLSSIFIDHPLLLCDDPNCDNISHRCAIDRMYTETIEALFVSSADLSTQQSRKHRSQIAGWNDYCEVAYCQARAFLHWITSNRPKHGDVFNHMKNTRSYFKLCLRKCRLIETRAQADSLAKKLIASKSKQFWKEIKKINGEDQAPLASTIV